MNKKIDKLAHLFLYFGYVVGAVAIYMARYNPTRQFFVIILLVAFYVLWGFVYHHAKREASGRLFLEYLLIALIAILAGFFVLMA
jgi:uncharacterized membrane protein YfcA